MITKYEISTVDGMRGRLEDCLGRVSAQERVTDSDHADARWVFYDKRLTRKLLKLRPQEFFEASVALLDSSDGFVQNGGLANLAIPNFANLVLINEPIFSKVKGVCEQYLQVKTPDIDDRTTDAYNLIRSVELMFRLRQRAYLQKKNGIAKEIERTMKTYYNKSANERYIESISQDDEFKDLLIQKRYK